MDPLNYSIYVIQGITTRFIKIGVTGGVSQRIDEIQAASPDELEILWQSRKMSRLEAYRFETHLHKKFDAFRVRNEWFFPEIPLLEFVTELKIAAPLDHSQPANDMHFNAPDRIRRTWREAKREKGYKRGLELADAKFQPKSPRERKFYPVPGYTNKKKKKRR